MITLNKNNLLYNSFKYKYQKENGDIIIKFVTFLIFPFISFLYSFRRINTRSSLLLVFSFCLVYGLSFTVVTGKDEKNTNDGARYRELFEYYSTFNNNEYKKKIISILKHEGYERDLYYFLIAFFTSRLSTNYHILFFVLAAFFSYFMVKSLSTFAIRNPPKICIASFLLTLLFLNNFIFNINGVRFFTAYWVAVYAIIMIEIYEKQEYYILLIITPLVHAAFICLLLIYGIYKFFLKNESIWIKLFCFSMLLSGLSVELTRIIVGYLPGSLQAFANYVSEKGLSRQENWSLIRTIFSTTSLLYINYLFFLLYKEYRQNPKFKDKKLLRFLLVFMTIVNFLMPVPSLGTRFFMMSYPLIAILWMGNFGIKKNTIYIYIMPIMMLYDFHRFISLFSRFVEYDFYYSNLFYLIFKQIS